MQVRIRESGAVMYENEFRALFPSASLPTLTEEVLDSLGADVVFEGPQATGGTRYQYSIRDGVEEINGQWFTKYILGPVFTGETAAADEAAYIAMKDAEFGEGNAARAKQELQATDWSENASVRNTTVFPHLTNAADFDTYRLALRAIVIGKPHTVESWPARPEATWATE